MFVSFSVFIKACGRELSDSNFLYLLWSVFLYWNSPKQLIWTRKPEFRLKGLNVIFTEIKRKQENQNIVFLKYIQFFIFVSFWNDWCKD